MGIIRGLSDTDLYKLTMMQVIFEKYTNVKVRYDFKCRTGNVFDGLINPSAFLVQLNEELNEYCSLRFTKDELYYLSSIRFFKPNFIEYLRLYQPNREYVHIGSKKDLTITVVGPWISTIPFEVPQLAMVSELYHIHSGHNNIDRIAIGQENLMKKIGHLCVHIPSNLLPLLEINEGGTRRRYSYENQDAVIKTGVEYKILSGTSNIHFAQKYGIKAVGTMAHEYICAHQQLAKVEDSQKAAFQAWADVYRGDLGIALSDTVGFEAFLRDFDLYFAKLFDGCRHDSGDPFNWGDRLIAHYKQLRIDPNTKIAGFSDGLTFKVIVDLFLYFNGSIKPRFLIGTDYANDVGVRPLQIVMKMTECNGRPVAKVSDSSGKGMCLDPRFESYVKQVFSIK